MPRHDGRHPNQLRPVSIERRFLRNADGSVLYRAGGTAVIVSAQISNGVPPFLVGRGSGWLTAEYAMLPGSTPGRKDRRTDGRATEIQRLIGRSLRAIVDLPLLGPHTLHIDADVIEADGGTRTAAITGACVAAIDALTHRFGPDRAARLIKDHVAAVSVGLVGNLPVLDLDYPEDSTADVDLNVVRLASGGYIEIQGTGEHGSFDRAQLDQLLALADHGINRLVEIQRQALQQSEGDRPSLPG
jgi:ribonuclease PH